MGQKSLIQLIIVLIIILISSAVYLNYFTKDSEDLATKIRTLKTENIKDETELAPSASSLRGRGSRRGGHHAPRLAGSFEPGLAASRHGRHRVLHGEPSRALTFGPLVARPRLPPRGPSRPAAGGLLRAWLSGLSPRTPSRPSWRALSSSHLWPLSCEAEASAAGAITPRGWRAPSSLA